MAQAAIFFEENFQDNWAGWTVGSDWQIGPTMSPAGRNFENPDPTFNHIQTADNSGPGVVIGGNASTILYNYYHLISPALTSAAPAVQRLLSFTVDSKATMHHSHKIISRDGMETPTRLFEKQVKYLRSKTVSGSSKHLAFPILFGEDDHTGCRSRIVG